MPLGPVVIEMLLALVLLIPREIIDTDNVIVLNIVHIITKPGPVILVKSTIYALGKIWVTEEGQRTPRVILYIL